MVERKYNYSLHCLSGQNGRYVYLRPPAWHMKDYTYHLTNQDGTRTREGDRQERRRNSVCPPSTPLRTRVCVCVCFYRSTASMAHQARRQGRWVLSLLWCQQCLGFARQRGFLFSGVVEKKKM